jgi:hypothetical protein
MKFKIWRPDAGETVEDAREYVEDDARLVAKAAAEYDHANRDGWEWEWPVTYHVQDSSGRTVSVEVNRETVPEFWAERAKPVKP